VEIHDEILSVTLALVQRITGGLASLLGFLLPIFIFHTHSSRRRRRRRKIILPHLVYVLVVLPRAYGGSQG
jgi:hypothetical protein